MDDEPKTPKLKPLLTGRFNLYDTPDGGFHIAYLPDGMTETQHVEIPAMIIRTARAFAAGKVSPMALFGMMKNE